MNFASLYLIFEDILVKFCGESREGNFFCLRMKDAEYLLVGLLECMIRGDFNSVIGGEYRYASLNMNALRKFGSLEFRGMRSPEDFMDIETWTNILLKLKDAAQEFETPREIIEQLSMDGVQQFTRKIFGDQYSLVQCHDMEDLIMDSVRYVQNYAYVPRNKKKSRKASTSPRLQERTYGTSTATDTINFIGTPEDNVVLQPPEPPPQPDTAEQQRREDFIQQMNQQRGARLRRQND